RCQVLLFSFFFSSRRRHTRFKCDWSSDVCSSDLRLQIDKLSRLKSERKQAEVDAALAALTRSAGDGNGNLLALAIDAARAKATVGEISDALEKVFGRHRAEIKSITGVDRKSTRLNSSHT